VQRAVAAAAASGMRVKAVGAGHSFSGIAVAPGVLLDLTDLSGLVHVDRDLAERHYAEHAEKPFFGELVEFITSGPTLALVLEGESAIPVVRTTMGSTNPADSAPGTIRGDLALAMPDNLVHGSDAPESAQREIELWFPDDA